MVDAGVLVPGRACLIRTYGEKSDLKTPDQEYRNSLIAYAAQTLMSYGKKVLVLGVEVRHVERLSQLIPGSIAVDGRDNSRVRPALDHLSNTPGSCVVGTSVIGEGVDVPVADALVYAAGSRAKVKVMQDVSRVLTGSHGKEIAMIVDFADVHSDAGMYRSADRLTYYREAGFEVQIVNPVGFPQWVSEVLRGR
jgi:superfamily II DNA or RNA helicase